MRVPDVEVLRQTRRAILVTDGDTETWVPLSVVLPESEVFEEGDTGDLLVADWFGEKQGWR